jgi:Glycosyl transferase family 11
VNIVRLTGGLGNQLFQVAAALYLKETTRSSVRCDASWYDLAADGHRVLEVARILRDDELVRIPVPLARALYWRHNRRFRRWRLIAVYQSGPDDDLVERRPRWPAVLDGYFQRSKYPLATQDELRKRLKSAVDAEPAAAVGVHVRMGDYVDRPFVRNRLGLTAPSFFAEAIALARAEVGPLPVRVFTDSPELLDAHLGDALPKDAEIAKAGDAWTALGEMSRCRALVMSNSSLSWWAAFVGSVLDGREMHVVMPKPWWATPTSADVELRLPGWHQIEREMVGP